MRMGSSDLTAADIVNTYSEEKMADIFFNYGEERKSRKFASLICDYRKNKLFETTTELADLVAKNSPKVFHKKKKMHPATLIFQALRIAVNDELHEFEIALNQCHRLLSVGGRLLTVTFHSLEDRVAKNYFKQHSLEEKQSKYAQEKIAPTNLYQLITKKPTTATEAELKQNPRSSSAKLRSAIRTDI
jgi:16S rRNA (cytosine1402-N4)-methyltransferase